jgi:Tfp pilus assembly protein PilE
MGQQQLLLIILGVVVVGIAVVIGITMFQDNAISANRDAVTSDLVYIGARAQEFYRRPYPLGGGQKSFKKKDGTPMKLGDLVGPVTGDEWANPNGTYSIEGTPTDEEVTLKGIGFEKTDGRFVEVHCRVTPESLQTTVIN